MVSTSLTEQRSQTGSHTNSLFQCSTSAVSRMDDVWGNAWAQPEEDVAHSLPTKNRTSEVSAWSLPSDEKGRHEEADVGMPSWSTGELNWTEPTGGASLWSSASVVDDLALETSGWGTSSGLSSKSNSQIGDVERTDDYAPRTDAMDADDASDEITEHEERVSRSSTPVSIGTVTSVTDGKVTESLEDSILPPTITSSSFEVTEVAKASGSFEDGDASVSNSFDDGRFTWASPVAAFEDENGEADAWGSAWRTPDLTNTDDTDDGGKDEWVLAREQKAKRDRSVPPELLAAIIDHLNGLSEGLWKEDDKPQFDESLGNWRDGLNNAVDLEELMQRALPETNSQPPIKFSGSHVAKAMGKSIKLSKNLSIVRNSPLSHLFTAKSLAAWELSVKTKTEVIKDDIPAGWKAVEPEQKKEAKTATMEKRSTGIFSFFSKRTSSSTGSPVAAPGGTDSKRSSLSREVTSDSASISSAKRNSSDVASLSSKLQQSSSVTSLSSVPAPLPSPSTVPSSTRAAPSTAPAVAVPDQAPSDVPSAVSRFFNRFSRSRSDTRSSASSPRSSLALSTDDLEFLSDIVPSHSDEADEEDRQLQALSALVSSPVQPAKLPPPLAPPPLAPPPRPSSRIRATTPHPQPQSQPLVPILVASLPTNSSDPVGGLTNPNAPSSSSSQSVLSPTSKGTLPTALPPPLPPPLSPTSVASLSKPPTPSPVSGGVTRPGHSRTSTISSVRSSSVSPTPPRLASPRPMQSPLGSGAASVGSAVATLAGNLNAQGLSASNFSPLSPIPPPPLEKSPNRIYASSHTNLPQDSDDFSEFQSHATPSISVRQTNSSVTNGQSLFVVNFDTPTNNVTTSANGPVEGDLFGDFGSFVSHISPKSQASSLRSPPSSPLSPPIGVPPPLPRKQPPANLNTLHVRKPSASDHDATARLLERAAARPGRWPAPPSPIPNPLPPPPSSGANSRTSTSGRSLLEFDDGVAQAPVAPVRSIPLKPIAEIMSAGAAPSKAVSPPPLFPPPSSVTKQNPTAEASLLDFDDFAQPTQSHLVHSQTSIPLPTSSAGSTKSGLSAQDLSFFEGL